MDAILLTGKTGLFSDEALEYIGKKYQVLVAGRKNGRREEGLPENVRVFRADPTDSDFPKVFETSAIRAVWHVSACADGGRAQDESRILEAILRQCARYGVPRLIVLTESHDPTDYRAPAPVEVAAIRLPLLSGGGLARGRLNRMFDAMRKKKAIWLEGQPGTRMSILPVQELAALLVRMTGEASMRPGDYSVDGAPGQMEDFRRILLSVRPEARIEYAADADAHRSSAARGAAFFRIPVRGAARSDGQLEEIYRFPVTADWGTEVSAQYAASLAAKEVVPTWRERARGVLRPFGRFAGALLDLAVMFLVSEMLARITSDSVYFKIVDIRLLFVILMGTMHGLAVGMSAALLECVVLVLRYGDAGISWLLLFYNVENWIPFVYYLTAGVISGYSHQKNVQERHAVMAENELVRDKYLFLNEAYRACVSDRRELRAQILSERESYGKLYNAFREMSQRTPEAVCVQAVRVLRRMLENDTVMIYELDGRGNARILPCCLEGAQRQAFCLSDCPPMHQALREGQMWKNTAFLEDAPMYGMQLRYIRASRPAGEREANLLVAVERASLPQMSAWYASHFSILCGFFQDALDHAALREQVL